MFPDERIKPPDPGENLKEWWCNSVSEMIVPSDPELRAVVESAQDSLIEFIEYTFPRYLADPFHVHLCNAIEGVVAGNITNLMLFAPPQHGKSTIVSHYLPGYFLAHNPDLPVALISYSSTLSDRNSLRARQVVESWRYQELFPHIRKDPKRWKIQSWYLDGYEGFVHSAGVGGSITGHGFGLGIIDDPYKGWAEAQSDRIRKSVRDWYDGTYLNRIWEHGRTVIMQTRWNKGDLCGQLLEEEGEVAQGGRWVKLSYPALALEALDLLDRKKGEALAPSRYSRAFLEDMKSRITQYIWLAVYQQNPIAAAGNFFKIQQIDIQEAAPPELCQISTTNRPINIKRGVRIWDLAATEVSPESPDPDYTTGVLLAQDDAGRFWVLDVIRGRYPPEQLDDMIKLTARVDGRKVKIRIEQEPGAAGKIVISNYIRMLAGYDVDSVSPTGEKMTRARPFASQVNIGNVIFLSGDWNKDALSEMQAFPFGAHDDIPDGMSHAFNQYVDPEGKFRDMPFMSV